MGIIDTLKYKFLKRNITEEDFDAPLLKALLGNKEITREEAMSIPAVASSVDLISSMIASMPIKLYKDKGEKVEEIKDDYRIALLNDDTKDLLDGVQWKNALVNDYLMGKGGYSFIKRQKNKITGLYYVECEKITPYKNEDPIYKECKYNIYGEDYKNYEIFRILRNTKDGVTGVPITSEISNSLETAFTTLMYQLNLVKKGGNKKGFLTSDKKLTQEAIDKLKEAWRKMYQTNEENVVILNEGLSFKESSNSSVEMQLDQSKNTLIKEIKLVFHIEDTFDETFKKGILPIIKILESSLNRYLLLESEKKEGFFFEFDTKEITKANLKERYEAYEIALRSGWKNKNEVRYEENEDRVEGLDAYNMSLGSVLFDPKTQTYFVPNTGQVKSQEDNKLNKNNEGEGGEKE